MFKFATAVFVSLLVLTSLAGAKPAVERLSPEQRAAAAERAKEAVKADRAAGHAKAEPAQRNTPHAPRNGG